MAHEPAEVVEVRIWGETVGAVSVIRGGFGFQYTPSWKRTGIELSPLSMPLGSKTSVSTFPARSTDTFSGGYFSVR